MQGKIKLPKNVSGAVIGDPDQCRREFDKKHDLTIVCGAQSRLGSDLSNVALRAEGSQKNMLIEDRYGSSVPALQMFLNSGQQKHTAVVFSDQAAMDHAKKRIGEQIYAPHLKLAVEGNPFYEEMLRKAREGDGLTGKRENIRSKIKAKKNHVVILVAGQMNDTALILTMIAEAVTRLRLVKEEVKVIVRAHPRATPEDKRALDAYLAATGNTWFVDPGKDVAPTSDDCLPGADFVLSGFSTTSYLGILYEMQGVIFVGTSGLMKDLKEEKELDVPAEVEAGWAWYAQNTHSLVNAMRGTRECDQQMAKILEERRRSLGLNHEGAAQRIAQMISTSLS